MKFRFLLLIATVFLLGQTAASEAQMFPAPEPVWLPAKEVAPFDPTGYWVSIVTEDWRFRMATPMHGDFPGVPLNQDGTRIANQWDPQKDKDEGQECKAFGAPRIMREPGRLHITWQDENTLKIETDAGRQTRLLKFGDAAPADAPSRQGFSKAEWRMHGAGRGRPPESGSIRVVTTNLLPGYLRKNGVPYSEQTTVTEYFDLIEEPNGDRYLVVKTIVDDPVYLLDSYIVSSNFRRMDGRSGWNPRDCEVPPPPPGEATGYR